SGPEAICLESIEGRDDRLLVRLATQRSNAVPGIRAHLDGGAWHTVSIPPAVPEICAGSVDVDAHHPATAELHVDPVATQVVGDRELHPVLLHDPQLHSFSRRLGSGLRDRSRVVAGDERAVDPAAGVRRDRDWYGNPHRPVPAWYVHRCEV